MLLEALSPDFHPGSQQYILSVHWLRLRDLLKWERGLAPWEEDFETHFWTFSKSKSWDDMVLSVEDLR